ncbi:MAG: hypothetical protein KGL95_11170 [Patescibacteria group bacterium]|nr:hypothetical protein [Patescibacteria group bacterium]
MTVPSKGNPFSNMFSNLSNWFFSFDKFTRVSIVTGVVIILCVPAIIGQETGFFSHAGNSLFTTCVEPPPGFDEQELQMMSQSRKVNWCRTLAQAQTNPQGNSAQDSGDQGNNQPTNNTIFFPVVTAFQQFYLTIRKLLLGY